MACQKSQAFGCPLRGPSSFGLALLMCAVIITVSGKFLHDLGISNRRSTPREMKGSFITWPIGMFFGSLNCISGLLLNDMGWELALCNYLLGFLVIRHTMKSAGRGRKMN
jgi:hypothetical protein